MKKLAFESAECEIVKVDSADVIETSLVKENSLKENEWEDVPFSDLT